MTTTTQKGGHHMQKENLNDENLEKCEPADGATSDEQGNPAGHVPGEITLQAILELAKAVQQIRSLEELEGKNTVTEGCRISVRRRIMSLAQECCTPRRIVALMLHAADNPDWAWVNFWAAFCPEMTLKQMASLRKINKSTVLYYLQKVELPADAYEFLSDKI